MDILSNILNFFIPNAYADTAAAPQQGGGFSLLIMLGIFVFFMYFAIWRPQSKRAREHRDLIGSLTKGDEVITTGGILGRIAKITDQYLVISIAENVEITVQKSAIANALPKGTLKSIQ